MTNSRKHHSQSRAVVDTFEEVVRYAEVSYPSNVPSLPLTSQIHGATPTLAVRRRLLRAARPPCGLSQWSESVSTPGCPRYTSPLLYLMTHALPEGT
jgi:hypothetical protein